MADKLEIMEKSYVSSPQDEWVNGNMKTILDWAKKYNNAQYYNIKNAFSNYRKASGLNSKVKAFQEIQNSLVNKDGVPLADKMKSWYDEFEPKIRENADLYHNGDVDKVSLKPETKQMKDIWDAIRPSLSSIPKNEENDADLDVGDIYKENYNPNQMAKLAAQYGYDYKDKNDRSEFLSLASKYNQEKDLEKIWNEPSFGNIVTKIAYPVSTEYAKQNYNEIPTDSFWHFVTGGENGKGMAKPMLVDAIDNTVPPFSIAAGTRINVFSPVDLIVSCQDKGINGKCSVITPGSDKRRKWSDLKGKASFDPDDGSWVGQVRSFDLLQYCEQDSKDKWTINKKSAWADSGYEYRTVLLYCESLNYTAVNK